MKKANSYQIVVIGLIFLIILIRNFYSFCQSDEVFYLSTVDRIWRGDLLIIDEYHPSQFSSLVILPLYNFFRFISKDGDYLILAFRIITITFGLGVSIYLYSLLKKETDAFVALVSSMIFFLFCQGSILGASYYTFFQYFSSLAILFYIDYIDRRKNVLLFLSGLASGLSVLEMPYTALLIVLIVIVSLVRCIKYKKENTKILMFYLIGVVAIATITVCFLLSRATLTQYLQNINNLFVDSEHKGSALSNLFEACVGLVKFALKNSLYVALVTTLTFINNRLRKLVPLVILARIIICVLFENAYINEVYFVLFLGLVPTLISNIIKRKEYKTYLVSIFGLLLFICFAFGSNTREDTLLPSGVLIISYLVPLLYERGLDDKNEYIQKSILIMFLVAIIAARFINVYRDDSFSHLNTQIKTGVAAGLITTKQHAIQYDNINEVLNLINNKQVQGKVIVSKILPWAYIALNNKAGAPTTWRTYINDKNLVDYSKNQNIGIVLLLNEEIGCYLEDETPNKNVKEGELYSTIEEWDSINTKIGTVYICDNR